LQVRRPAHFALVASLMAMTAEPVRAGDPNAIVAPLERACSACHKPDGIAGDAPPLANLLADAKRGRPAEASRLFAVLVNRHGGAAAMKPKWPEWPSAAEIAALMAWLDSAPRPAPTAASTGGTASPPRLALATDRLSYGAGGEVRLHVAASQPCHLTLLSIDPAGRTLLLFPNERERSNALRPGETRTIPSADAGYRLRAREQGRERILAWCTAEPAPLAGLRFAFDTQRFATLGRWPDALARMLAASESLEAGTLTRTRRGRSDPEPVSLFADHATAAVAFDVTP